MGEVGFWYDTVLMYCMLRKNGYAKDDIYVLYGDGRDGIYGSPNATTTEDPQDVPNFDDDNFASQDDPHDQSTNSTDDQFSFYTPPFCGDTSAQASQGAAEHSDAITDFPAIMPNNKGVVDGDCRPRQMFHCLAHGCDDYHGQRIDQLENGDFLFVWWRGHGAENSTSGEVDLTIHSRGSVSGSQVINWIDEIKVEHRLIAFETCHSGCVSKQIDTTHPKSVVLLSAGCDETSNGLFQPDGDVPHALWSYWTSVVLMGETPNPGSTQVATSNGPVNIKLALGEQLNESFCRSSVATKALMDVTQTPEKHDATGLAFTTTVTGESYVGPSPPSPSLCTPTPTPSPVKE
jgi:hypothetical protein